MACPSSIGFGLAVKELITTGGSASTVTVVEVVSEDCIELEHCNVKVKEPASAKVTDWLPDGNEITLPAQPPVPSVAMQLSALLTVQDRVVDSPSASGFGLAEKELITTGGLASTVTVVEAVSEDSNELEHCNVKVKDPASAKVTDWLPDGNEITLPAQPPVPSMATQLSALLTVQDRVVDSPKASGFGLAAKASMTTGGLASTVTVVEAISEDPNELEHCNVKVKDPAPAKVTDWLPDGNEITLPAQPPVPSMAMQLSALLTDQESVVDAPSATGFGLAVKASIVTSGGAVTITVALLRTADETFEQLSSKIKVPASGNVI